MENQSVDIMDINFLNTTKEDFLNEYLAHHLAHEEKCFVVTANPEIVMKTQADDFYQKVVQSADYVVPDGIGVIFASRLKRTPLKERIPGIELMTDLLAHANDQHLRCYFLGAKEAVNKQAVANIQEKFPNVVVAGRHHGYFDATDETFVKNIVETSPDIIFVALGLPRQEQWIYESNHHFHKGLFIGIGGSFDVFAGVVKRAPDRWIRLHLEWLYRLLQQPSRIFRVFSLFRFTLRALFHR